MQDLALTPQMRFAEAFDIWITHKTIDYGAIVSNARFISARGERDLRQYFRAAAKFFHSLRMDEIMVGHLREYQKARALNLIRTAAGEAHPWERRAGANLIRKEIAVVTRVMRAAGAWTAHHEEFFEPLKVVESDVQRALSPDEQRVWLRAAASRPQWRLVYWWSIVALQTTAATNEMRSLRRSDIFLDQGIINVRSEGAKNKHRIRTIPLSSEEVVWALDCLLKRADDMGADKPFHYLFPLHITASRYNPLEPMTVFGMRKPWDAVRREAGLEWLRMYDLRHTAITRMAEAGMPIQVIMSFAGHISPRMQQHYTQISMQAKRRWMAAAWAGAEMPFSSPSSLGFPAMAGGQAHEEDALPTPRPGLRRKA
jgi:integrase